MILPRTIKWIAAILLAPLLLASLCIALFGWNWLRGPIERMASEKTGRVLLIKGDLSLTMAWPSPQLHAKAVSFANPPWATQRQMIAADAVDLSIDLRQLLDRKLVFPELRLERPVIFLERGTGGRKNWLLDINQQDEKARIRIGRLMLDQGLLGYDDGENKTSIRADFSTVNTPATGQGIRFAARGRFQGLPLEAHGRGGPVLALRDETTPYPLQAEVVIGDTGLSLDGSITSLLRFTAMDVRFELHGKSMADLYPLLGIVFPETGPYATDGHLIHSAKTWRYEKFSGRIGGSDVAGTLTIVGGGPRPAMQGELSSRRLDVADLGQLIGARRGRLDAARLAAPVPSQTAAPTPARARVLPDMPFSSERWDSVDAELSLKANAVHGAGRLPIEALVTHLSLRDSVLRLDPLSFRIAGGELDATVSLDGRQKPIAAQARVKAKKLLLARLLPAGDAETRGIGQISGEFDLNGNGDSVRSMLAGSSGKLGLVVSGGRISRLMMEKAGLHVWEIVGLKLTGDKLIKLRCGVADFVVKDGRMNANALVFDTEVTTIVGTGSIDLGQEKLDLTLRQKTKNTSPLALRSPIYVRGSFARPVLEVDKGRVAVRALGALALGLVNPLLVLLPLIDAGPGQDSDCGQLVREARGRVRPAKTTNRSVGTAMPPASVPGSR